MIADGNYGPKYPGNQPSTPAAPVLLGGGLLDTGEGNSGGGVPATTADAPPSTTVGAFPVLDRAAGFGPTSSALPRPSANANANDLSPAGASPAEPPASQPASTEGGGAPGVPFSFGPPPPAPCSTSRCRCGHQWVPELRIARCPGCQAPMLVLLMQNCPACNEPTAATDLRLDHMPQASAQLLPLCRGSATFAEALRIELRHTHAEDEERSHVVREVVSKV